MAKVSVLKFQPGKGNALKSHRLHRIRRATQLGTLVLLVLIPVSGLFRIDPVDGAFVVLDRQIWFSDFFIVFGLWLAIASGLVLTYSMLGMVFCGWSCPQNTLSEWANEMTHRWLGRRAEVTLDGARMVVAERKNRPLNWVILALIYWVAAMALAIIPMFYFYPPDVIWSFVTFREDERLAGSLHYIYFVFTLIIFLNIAFIRHFMCRFMCIYKIWQHSFKTRDTLRIVYDAARSADCEKCSELCRSQCFLGLDPKNTETYDACINCGECIVACDAVHAKKGEPGLLRFAVGWSAGRADLSAFRTNLGSFVGRVRWTIPFTLLGLALFAWGLYTYEPHRLTVYPDKEEGVVIMDRYRINLAHKLYRPAEIRLQVEGLPEGSYELERERVVFSSTGRADVRLTILPGLAPGIHAFLVRAQADDGWSDAFRVRHFVASGDDG